MQVADAGAMSYKKETSLPKKTKQTTGMSMSHTSTPVDPKQVAATHWLPPDQKPAHPIYVPLSDVKNWFSISRDTIYRAEKLGEVKIHRGSGRSVVKISEIQNWIESRQNNQNQNRD